MKKVWITIGKGCLENLLDLLHQIQNKQILKISKIDYHIKRLLDTNIEIDLDILIPNAQTKTVRDYPQCQNESQKLND